jgi:polyisoprenoid-binding protein YceI
MSRRVMAVGVLAMGILLFSNYAPPRVQAQATPVGTTTGVVDLEKSRVAILVDKVGLGHRHAVIGRLRDGRLRLNADREAGRLVFDMTSFVADTAEGRRYVGLEGETDLSTQKQVNANMLGKEVLHVERFPTAVFEVHSTIALREPSKQGQLRYALQGEFTLHGVTHPLTIYAEAIDKGAWLHLRGGFYLRQTDYGIEPFRKAFGAVGVADQLTVHGEIYLLK